MASEIFLIVSYFCKAGISTESQLSVNIPLASCATFHQHHRIDVSFVEIPFFGNLPHKMNISYYSLKNKTLNQQLTSIQ